MSIKTAKKKFLDTIKKIIKTNSRSKKPVWIIDQERKRQEINELILKDGGKQNGKILQYKNITVEIHPERAIEIFDEVFIQNNYHFEGLGDNFIAIDIGMNVGFSALKLAQDDRFKKIYGFEPVAPNFEQALKNFSLNPILREKIYPYNIGLSDRKEEKQIKYIDSEFMAASSNGTFDVCMGENHKMEKILIEPAAKSIRSLITKHNEKIFLKIDCEGAEFEILEDLEKEGLIKYISVAIIEWHGKSPDKITAILRKNNFAFFLKVTNPAWNIGFIKAISLNHVTLQ